MGVSNTARSFFRVEIIEMNDVYSHIEHIFILLFFLWRLRYFYSSDSRISRERMIVRSLLYIIAVILFLGWGIGYFLWRPGPLIHIMVLLALVAFVLGLSRKQGIR